MTTTTATTSMHMCPCMIMWLDRRAKRRNCPARVDGTMSSLAPRPDNRHGTSAMGREVRRVPAEWDHPRDALGRYIPLRASYAGAMESYQECYDGRCHLDCSPESRQACIAWKPDPDDFIPEPQEDAWWQLYECVSGGTPMSPPFPTQEALREHLLLHGEFGSDELPSPAAVDRLLEHGRAPSFMDSDYLWFGWQGDVNDLGPTEGLFLRQEAQRAEALAVFGLQLCHAPTKSGGRCRNAMRPGGRCAAGHTASAA